MDNTLNLIAAFDELQKILTEKSCWYDIKSINLRNRINTDDTMSITVSFSPMLNDNINLYISVTDISFDIYNFSWHDGRPFKSAMLNHTPMTQAEFDCLLTILRNANFSKSISFSNICPLLEIDQ